MENLANLFATGGSLQEVLQNMAAGIYSSDEAKEYYDQYQRKQREKTISDQMDELMRYLAMHEPEMLRAAQRVRRQHKHANIAMRNHLRKTIGEKHWRRYLDYYDNFSRTKRRIKVELTSAHTATPPPFPTLSNMLNDDVTTKIFSFLDGKAMYEASKVSRAFRDALVPRQRNVTFEGFKSFASFRRMNFMGMVYFTDGKSKFQMDDFIQTLSLDRRSYPNLERVFVRNCYGAGLRQYEDNMGPRFESIVDRFYADDD